MLPDRREGSRAGADPKVSEPRARTRARSVTGASKRPPRFGFLKGAALGAILVVPTVAATVWVLARLGIGKDGVTMEAAVRMAALFAGAAGVLTAGGIGRLAAHASVGAGGRKAAVVKAARAQAVAGAGLVLIAAIPHGELPGNVLAWCWFGVGGAVSGAVVGVVIGLVCGAPLAEAPGVPEILRRVPVVAEWARIAERDPRVRGEMGDGGSGTGTGTGTGTGSERRRTRAERSDDVVERIETPLPVPVPLGQESTTGVEAPVVAEPEEKKAEGEGEEEAGEERDG